MNQIANKIRDTKLIQKDNIYKFEIGIKPENYIIKLNKDENNENILISIFKDNINSNITYESYFNCKKLEFYDNEFFSSFHKNISLLFNFLIRLLYAKLVEIKPSIYGYLKLKLICLKDNKIGNIEILIDSKKKEIKQNNIKLNKQEIKKNEEN